MFLLVLSSKQLSIFIFIQRFTNIPNHNLGSGFVIFAPFNRRPLSFARSGLVVRFNRNRRDLLPSPVSPRVFVRLVFWLPIAFLPFDRFLQLNLRLVWNPFAPFHSFSFCFACGSSVFFTKYRPGLLVLRSSYPPTASSGSCSSVSARSFADLALFFIAPSVLQASYLLFHLRFLVVLRRSYRIIAESQVMISGT